MTTGRDGFARMRTLQYVVLIIFGRMGSRRRAKCSTATANTWCRAANATT